MTKNETVRDDVRLQHIMDEIVQIEWILAQPDRGLLAEAALERKYIIIGEASRAISADLRKHYSMVPWADIIAMRNILVHEYYKVERETLWDVAEHKIPALKDWVKGIIETHRNAGG